MNMRTFLANAGLVVFAVAIFIVGSSFIDSAPEDHHDHSAYYEDLDARLNVFSHNLNKESECFNHAEISQMYTANTYTNETHVYALSFFNDEEKKHDVYVYEKTGVGFTETLYASREIGQVNDLHVVLEAGNNTVSVWEHDRCNEKIITEAMNGIDTTNISSVVPVQGGFWYIKATNNSDRELYYYDMVLKNHEKVSDLPEDNITGGGLMPKIFLEQQSKKHTESALDADFVLSQNLVSSESYYLPFPSGYVACVTRDGSMSHPDQIAGNGYPCYTPLNPTWSSYHHSYHGAIDFNTDNFSDEKVLAAKQGIVTSIQYSTSSTGYGNRVEITHPSGYMTSYSHLENIYVCQGQYVETGFWIADEGNTGGSQGDHLHFECFDPSGNMVYPRFYELQNKIPMSRYSYTSGNTESSIECSCTAMSQTEVSNSKTFATALSPPSNSLSHEGLSGAGDIDWLSTTFTTSGISTLNIKTQAPKIDVIVEDLLGNIVSQTTVSSYSQSTLSWCGIAGEQYHISIQRLNNTSMSRDSCYEISSSFTTNSCFSVCVDVQEPNNSTTDAMLIPLIGGAQDHVWSTNACLEKSVSDRDIYVWEPMYEGELSLSVQGNLTLFDILVYSDHDTLNNLFSQSFSGLFSNGTISLCCDGDDCQIPLGEKIYIEVRKTPFIPLNNASQSYSITFDWKRGVNCGGNNYSLLQWFLGLPVSASGYPTVSVCQGDSVQLSLSSLGISQSQHCVWIKKSTGKVLGVGSMVSFIPTLSGLVEARVFDYTNNSCTGSGVWVDVETSPSVGVSQTVQGQSVILQAYGASSYLWSNGSGNSSIVVPQNSGTYSVQGTTNNCSDVAYIGTGNQVTSSVYDEYTQAYSLSVDCSPQTLTTSGSSISSVPAHGAINYCAPTSYSGNTNGNIGNYGNGYGDVWVQFIAPPSGSVAVEMESIGGIADGVMVVYDSLLQVVGCWDDRLVGGIATSFMPKADIQNLASGSIYYIRIWEFGNDAVGAFRIKACVNQSTQNPPVTSSLPDISIKSISLGSGIVSLNGNISVSLVAENTTSVSTTNYNLAGSITYTISIEQSGQVYILGTLLGVNLSANSQYSLSGSYTIPAGLVVGSAQIKVQADVLNLVQEISEANNTNGVPITVSSQPTSSFDVYIDDVSVQLESGYSWQPGALFDVDIEIDNGGNSTTLSPVFDVQIYFADDDILSQATESYYLGSLTFPSIIPGNEKTKTLHTSVPLISNTGNWYVVAEIQLLDSDISNNTDDKNVYIGTSIAAAPDLKITLLDVLDAHNNNSLSADSIFTNTDLGVLLEIENIGSADMQNSAKTSLFIQKAMLFDPYNPTDHFLDDIGRTLMIGEKDTIILSEELWEEGISIGSQYLRVQANSNNGVVENNYLNNEILIPITVLPDSTLSDLYGAISYLNKSLVDLGDSIELGGYIVNDTVSLDSFNGSTEITFYGSSLSVVLKNDVFLGKIHFNNISIGVGDTLFWNHKIQLRGKGQLLPGQIFIGGIIDKDGDFPEISKSNNALSSFPITLQDDECWYDLTFDSYSNSNGNLLLGDTLVADQSSSIGMYIVETEDVCPWVITGGTYYSKAVWNPHDSSISEVLVPSSDHIAEALWTHNSGVGSGLTILNIRDNNVPFIKNTKLRFGNISGGNYDSLNLVQFARPSPDYIVDTAWFSGAYGDSLVLGDTAEITYVIKNIGDGIGWGDYVRVYRTDSLKQKRGGSLYTQMNGFYPHSISVGGLDTFVYKFVLRGDSLQEKEFYMHIDPLHNAREYTYWNNEYALPFSLRDTAYLTDITITSSSEDPVLFIESGVINNPVRRESSNGFDVKYDLVLTYENKGNRPLTTHRDVHYYASEDSVFSSDDVYLFGRSIHDPIPACGMIRDTSIHVEFQKYTHSSYQNGWYYLFGIVNHSDTLSEYSFQNDTVRLFVGSLYDSLVMNNTGQIGITEYSPDIVDINHVALGDLLSTQPGFIDKTIWIYGDQRQDTVLVNFQSNCIQPYWLGYIQRDSTFDFKLQNRNQANEFKRMTSFGGVDTVVISEKVFLPDTMVNQLSGYNYLEITSSQRQAGNNLIHLNRIGLYRSYPGLDVYVDTSYIKHLDLVQDSSYLFSVIQKYYNVNYDSNHYTGDSLYISWFISQDTIWDQEDTLICEQKISYPHMIPVDDTLYAQSFMGYELLSMMDTSTFLIARLDSRDMLWEFGWEHDNYQIQEIYIGIPDYEVLFSTHTDTILVGDSLLVEFGTQNLNQFIDQRDTLKSSLLVLTLVVNGDTLVDRTINQDEYVDSLYVSPIDTGQHILYAQVEILDSHIVESQYFNNRDSLMFTVIDTSTITSSDTTISNIIDLQTESEIQVLGLYETKIIHWIGDIPSGEYIYLYDVTGRLIKKVLIPVTPYFEIQLPQTPGVYVGYIPEREKTIKTIVLPR